MLYFDHAASTPPWPEVITSVASTMERYYANPSSLHGLGQAAEQLLNKARHVIASSLSVDDSEIVFTGSGTESNNLAIKGTAARYRQRGMHMITSTQEHASVYEACRQLEQHGFTVTYLEPGRDGRVTASQVKAALQDDTILVSLMLVNNETGIIQPIEQISQLLSDYPKTLFHVDAVQGLGKVPFAPSTWKVDLFSVSAHKLNGPRGTGILYCRRGVGLDPLLSGGGQEGGARSGTEPLPQIAGMAKAIRLTLERQRNVSEHVSNLRSHLIHQLDEVEGVHVTTTADPKHQSPYIIHFCVPDVRSEVLVHALEQRDIYVSTRSACSSGEQKPSRVLLAMGFTEAMARSGIRVSLSGNHTMEDIDTLAEGIRDAVEQLRRSK